MKDCRETLKTVLNYKENCGIVLFRECMTLLIQPSGAFFKDFNKRRLFREAI